MKKTNTNVCEYYFFLSQIYCGERKTFVRKYSLTIAVAH